MYMIKAPVTPSFCTIICQAIEVWGTCIFVTWLAIIILIKTRCQQVNEFFHISIINHKNRIMDYEPSLYFRLLRNIIQQFLIYISVLIHVVEETMHQVTANEPGMTCHQNSLAI